LHNPPDLSEIEQRLQQLTNAVLAGKADEARQSTYAALARGASSNEVLDAVTEAVNIIVDLHDVGEYDSERLGPAENAIVSGLQVLEDRLVASQGRFNIKATVGPLGLKAGALLSLAMCAALRSVGFEAVNLSKTQTPLDLLRNSEELRAELVVPLLARDDVNAQLEGLLMEIERGGFKTKFEIIPVASGRREMRDFPLHVAENFSEAISKATEWALKKAAAHRSIDAP
jgi:methanogenic corrinoid protein MtbC1